VAFARGSIASYRHGAMSDAPDDHPFDDALAQIEVMRKVAELLRTLSPANAAKVVAWARDQLTGGAEHIAPQEEARRETPRVTQVSRAAHYAAFGDLFAESRAKSGPDRALVTGYWLQVCQGATDFEAADITRLLTDAGHALANTGATLRLLSSQRPVLVIQTQKKGTSKQSRKRYRLTTEGQRRVEALLNGANGEA
jgi:hypothetical protein